MLASILICLFFISSIKCGGQQNAKNRVIGVFLQKLYHFEASRCTGPSMEPTIFSNDVLFTERLSPRFQNLSNGDIIIAKCPSNPRQHICKRITGLPGDKIRSGFTTYVVPAGHVWLEGDNSDNSADSRIYGAVPQGLLRGRALCKVWPPTDVTLLTKKHVQPD